MALENIGSSRTLLKDIRRARSQLPIEHQNLLTQIGTQEGVVEDWPQGVQDLYRSIRRAPPPQDALAHAAAVWLDSLRTVVFDGPLVTAVTAGLTAQARGHFIAHVAWHEYGHALSVTRASHAQRRDGVRLLGLLPEGLREAIDYPAGIVGWTCSTK